MRRLFTPPWRRGRESELAEELAAHLEELTEELVNSGYSREDARYQAYRQFGNRTALLEEARDVWRTAWFDALARDLRFTWRLARRQPWMLAAVIASVAFGVGANTAVTSVLNTVLLNPLGIANSGRIMAATVHLNKLQTTDAETSAAEFRDLQSMTDVFSSVAATEHRAWTLEAGEPSRLIGLAVTPEFFQVFEQKPSLGRFFDPSDRDVVLLSHALWKSEFAGSPSVIARKLLLDGRQYQIIGVAPPDFHFPANVRAWVPLVLEPDRFQRGNNMTLSLFARLRAGVSEQRAQQRTNGYVGQLMKSAEGIDLRKLDYGIDLQPLGWRIAGDLRRPLWLLWAAALLLLITTCANVAGLLLARASNRRREIAIRISVGATSFQILRQLITESFMLGLAGGLVGLVIAAFSLELLKNSALPSHELLLLVRLNHRLLIYGLALALASSVVFGTIPALALLREHHTAATVRAPRRWFQNIYIAGEVAAAVILVIVGGLLLKSLNAIQVIQPGFDPRGLTTAFLIKPEGNRDAFFDRLLSELRTSPGVESAALGYSLPFGGDSPTSLFDIKGHHHLPGQPEWHAEAYQVSPGYFATLHIPLLRGRTISEFDKAGSPIVCVVDSSLARRFFPNEDPIGQEIAMYHGYARIVGVVSAIRDATLQSTSRPVVYYSLAQIPYFPQVGIVVRASIPAVQLIRNAVRRANPSVPVFDAKTMEDRIDASMGARSLVASMVAVFSAVSLLLAALGIHGVVAQIVADRTPEIGIRMALGARSSDILARYMMQGLRPAFLGIAIGLSIAAGCQRSLQSFLYQVHAIDPKTIVMSVMGVLCILALAILAPAWRASHIDPQVALRIDA